MKMLYIGHTPEVVLVQVLPRIDNSYVLVTGTVNGLQWFCDRDKLVELTPLLEALC